jgi:hypothetical protein
MQSSPRISVGDMVPPTSSAVCELSFDINSISSYLLSVSLATHIVPDLLKDVFFCNNTLKFEDFVMMVLTGPGDEMV